MLVWKELDYNPLNNVLNLNFMSEKKNVIELKD